MDLNKKTYWYDRIDKQVVITTLVILIAFFTWAFSDAKMGDKMDSIFKYVTDGFGWIYSLIAFAFVIFAIWLVFSPFGSLKLGDDDEKPRFSFATWFFMIFSCGIGVGLVYWGAAEPLSFLVNPPFGIGVGTPEAAEISMAYAFFHWGWTPWAIYMAVAAPVGYFMYRKGEIPRFSAMLRTLFGDKVDGEGFRFLDAFFVIGIIGGVTTATGLGIMQLASGLNRVFGMQESRLMYLLIAIGLGVLIVGTVVSGIDRGMKILSNLNMPLAIFLLIVVFLIGPTSFILNMTSTSIGTMAQNFLKMSFWTDPIGQSGFPQNWTIFYWAWWIASAPSTGMFVASISRGRTFREIVIVHMLCAPIFSWLWFGGFGGNAFYMEIFQNKNIAQKMAEVGTNGVIFEMMSNFPFGQLLSTLFVILILTFLATTVNSYAYVCAQVSTLEQYNPQEPPKAIRATWATAIILLGITLVMVGKGISGLQLSSVLASIVIMLVMVLMCIAMIKSLYDEGKNREAGNA